mgnify:FL=1
MNLAWNGWHRSVCVYEEESVVLLLWRSNHRLELKNVLRYYVDIGWLATERTRQAGSGSKVTR